MTFDNYACDGQMNLFDYMSDAKPLQITKPIRLIELFAGIGSQYMALKRIGANVTSWKAIEWDKYACMSYNAIHGTNIEPTDICTIKGVDLDIKDVERFTYLLTYSFPCQDLSVAGKGRGMTKDSGTRSGLLWEVERLLKECKEYNGNLPQVLLMENVTQVHGKKNIADFKQWIDFLTSLGYTNVWQDLNAKDYGVAQNRNRCFMVSFLGNYTYQFPKPIPLTKTMKDYLEDEVDEKFYVNSDRAKELLDKLEVEGILERTNERTNERTTIDLSLHEPKEINVANCISRRTDRGVSARNKEGSGVCEYELKEDRKCRR